MIRKRRKSSRYRASQTHKGGKKAETRSGKGLTGGRGMAGSGKRADHKKSLVIKLTGGNNYFGKSKTLRRGKPPAPLKVINLFEISQKMDSLLRKGIAKKEKDKIVLNLEGYKILGKGELTSKIQINASQCSASVKEKIKSSGSTIILKEDYSEMSDKKEKDEKKTSSDSKSAKKQD